MDSKCAVIIDSLHLTSMTSASKNLGILAQIFGVLMSEHLLLRTLLNTAAVMNKSEAQYRWTTSAGHTEYPLYITNERFNVTIRV